MVTTEIESRQPAPFTGADLAALVEAHAMLREKAVALTLFTDHTYSDHHQDVAALSAQLGYSNPDEEGDRWVMYREGDCIVLEDLHAAPDDYLRSTGYVNPNAVREFPSIAAAAAAVAETVEQDHRDAIDAVPEVMERVSARTDRVIGPEKAEAQLAEY